MLIVGRFLNGLCVGICSAQVPVYVGELAPPHLRGLVMGAQQWAITWGVLIMFYLSYGSSFLPGTIAFRLPWGLQMIPAVILFFGLFFTPESPRWLAKRDRWMNARKSYHRSMRRITSRTSLSSWRFNSLKTPVSWSVARLTTLTWIFSSHI